MRPALQRAGARLESDETLSVVSHALLVTMPHDTSLIVVPVHQTPRSRGMAPGTTSWLRERTRRV
ncbi:MAG: hypothetical protein WKF73_03085 [Nocardioidaceae bacterium]